MLAIPSFTLLTIPIFNFSTITDKINSRVEKQLQSSIETLTEDEKLFHDFAYIKNEVLSVQDMNNIEKMEDAFLFYSDTLADIIEDDTNRASNLYQYFDELYTLTLKITTAISYIRSKNRQLLNVA